MVFNFKKMKKTLKIIIILFGIYALYEQSKPEPNVWISAFGITVFMLGLFFLNHRTSSNSTPENDKKDENKTL